MCTAVPMMTTTRLHDRREEEIYAERTKGLATPRCKIKSKEMFRELPSVVRDLLPI
jgi:hypothetical protein